MAIRGSRIAIAHGCDPHIAMSVRSFDFACSPSYTTASKRWSVWRLLSEHVEPAVLEAFERRQPGYYTSWFGAGGLTRWMRQDVACALADRRLKSLHRVVEDPLKPSVETLRNLVGYVAGLQSKRAIPEEIEPLKGAPQKARLRRAPSEPYCELCWRLSQRSEAIERGDPTYHEPPNADTPTRWLSNRFCIHHDPKDSSSSYRRDLRYRGALEAALRSLRRIVNTDPAFCAAIARDDSNLAWPPDLLELNLASSKTCTAFSPLIMRMRWHAYQIARNRPSDSTISMVRLVRLGHSKADIALQLQVTPQAVSKALKQIRGVFDFTRPAALFWMADPSEAPAFPTFNRASASDRKRT